MQYQYHTLHDYYTLYDQRQLVPGERFIRKRQAKIRLTIVMNPATDTRPAMTWELDAAGDKIAGVQKRGETTLALTGVRAPELKRSAPGAWTDPKPLFNGKNLDGWQPFGNPTSHWVAKDGLLVNEDHGANLKSVRTFDDFKAHFEVNCPDGGPISDSRRD